MQYQQPVKQCHCTGVLGEACRRKIEHSRFYFSRKARCRNISRGQEHFPLAHSTCGTLRLSAAGDLDSAAVSLQVDSGNDEDAPFLDSALANESELADASSSADSFSQPRSVQGCSFCSSLVDGFSVCSVPQAQEQVDELLHGGYGAVLFLETTPSLDPGPGALPWDQFAALAQEQGVVAVRMRMAGGSSLNNQLRNALTAVDSERVTAMAQAIYEQRRESNSPGGPETDWQAAQLLFARSLLAERASVDAGIVTAVEQVLLSDLAARFEVQLQQQQSLASAAVDAASAATEAASLTEQRCAALEQQVRQLEAAQESWRTACSEAEAQARQVAEELSASRSREAMAAAAADAAKESLAFVNKQADILRAKVAAERDAAEAAAERVRLLAAQLAEAQAREQQAGQQAGEAAQQMGALVATLRSEVGELQGELAAAEARERELAAALEAGAQNLEAAAEAKETLQALRLDAEATRGELQAAVQRAEELAAEVEAGRKQAEEMREEVERGKVLAMQLQAEAELNREKVKAGDEREAKLLREVTQLREVVSRMKQDDSLFAEEQQRWQRQADEQRQLLTAVGGLAAVLPLVAYFLASRGGISF